MQRIPEEAHKILSDRLKIDNTKVTVRVEVDKYVYNPSLTTEIDYVQFYADTTSPSLIAGTESAPNLTSAATVISPIKNTTATEILSASKLSSPFGMRTHPLSKEYRMHNGIDLDYPKGTKLVAVADGIVRSVSVTGIRYVEILHSSNGYLSRYLHLGDIYVKKGERVTQNQEIAEIGATDSYSTGEHLHFEIREGASKSTIGTAVDPVPFIQKSKQLFTVAEKPMSGTGTVVLTGGAKMYKSPSIDAEIKATVANGTSVALKGKYGEWLYVTANGADGYIYGTNVQLSDGGGSTQPDANPSPIVINNYIKTYCAEKGLPALLGQAIAWTESGWKQFNSDGSVFVAGNDYGIMQINKPSHPDAFPIVETDWKANVRYGINYATARYLKAKTMFSNVNDIARATYSAYNTGSNYTRWKDTVDNRDVNFYNHYKKQPWMESIASSNAKGDSASYGVVTGTTISVRETAEIKEDNVIVSVRNGMLLEIVGSQPSWYKVKLVDGRIGYIPDKYLKPVDEAVSTDFQVTRTYFDNFEKYTLKSVPTTYKQDASKKWKISNDGSSNVLRISGGAEGDSNYFEIVTSVQHSGRLDFYCKLDLSQGVRFSVLDNGSVIYTTSNRKDNDYTVISIPLLSGSHALRFVRDKVLEGNDAISIDNIAVFSYNRVSTEKSNSSLAEYETDMEFIDTVSIKADTVHIYSTKDATTTPISTVGRGQVFPCKDAVRGQWITVKFDDGSLGYIKYENTKVVVYEGGYTDNHMSFRTGGFNYEKTLTLSNVVGVEIDYKEDMRAAVASVTIENFMGYYSPDARFDRFPENGIVKSPFVEYDNGNPWGILSDNTPIRIYIGYGDNPPRRFTGLIDNIDIDGEGQTLTIRCTDMMKKLINYVTYKPLTYPPDGDVTSAWLVSSVVHDLARKAGIDSWRVIDEDLYHPDIIIEETLCVDIDPYSGHVTKFSDKGEPYEVKIESLPVEGGYENPYIWANKTIPAGTSIADEIEEACQYLNYWQRCDCFGTYKFTPSSVDSLPVKYFKDTEDLISINKTIDYSNVRNHLIISGGGNEEHFIDKDLWRATKGERRTANVPVIWANTYGKKKQVAEKLFNSMRKKSRTMQAVVEGNPYLELLDTVGIEHRKSATMDNYIIKGMRDSWSTSSGYLTYLDLYWTGGNL